MKTDANTIKRLEAQRAYHLERAHHIGQTIIDLQTETRITVRDGAGNVMQPEPKRRFSAAARRRMSAGMRRFWARRKAAGKATTK